MRHVTHLHKHPFQVGNYNSCQDRLPRETEKAVLFRGMVFHVMIYKSPVISLGTEQGNYAISVPRSGVIPSARVPAASPRQQWQSSQPQPRECQQPKRHTAPMNRVLSPPVTLLARCGRHRAWSRVHMTLPDCPPSAQCCWEKWEFFANTLQKWKPKQNKMETI